MENKEILKANLGLSPVEIPEISTDLVETSGFEGLGKEKIDALKEAISGVNDLIQERGNLSEEILNEGEVLKTEINNFLLENQDADLTDHDASIEKNNLRAKKITISELQLNEKIDCWKDVALLKKELRIYERELKEKQTRFESLNKLLSESD